MKKLLIYLPIFVFFIQIIDTLINGYLSYPRAFILIAIIFFNIVFKKNRYDRISKILIIFLIYTFIISIFSSNYFITIAGYFSTLVSMTFYILSYNTFKNYNDFLEFKKWLFWIPLIFLFDVVIYTGFHIGPGVYGGSGVLITGDGLHHNTIYIGVLVIVLSFELIKYSKMKLRDIIFTFFVIIIILLSFRRTAIILIILSYFTYIIMGNKKNVIKYLFGILLLMIATFPIYRDPLINVIEARGSRATMETGIENTSRYREIVSITEKNLESTDWQYRLFGTEYLNSFDTYGSEEFIVSADRILHTDYAVILHGAGFIGLTIYFMFIILTLLKSLQCIKVIGVSNSISIMLMSMTFILIGVTFSGSLLNITFRTAFFIMLGALNRISDDEINRL